MSQAIEQLVRRRIEIVEQVHDYVQFRFDDDSVLSIYNPIVITGEKYKGLSSLIGRHIADISTDKTTIALQLTDGILIRVSMLNSDFRGPEAMQYNSSNGTIMVWP